MNEAAIGHCDDKELIKPNFHPSIKEKLLREKLLKKIGPFDEDLMKRIDPYYADYLPVGESVTKNYFDEISKIIRILRKPVPSRTDEDVNFLLQFVKYNPFYDAMKEEYPLDLFKYIIKSLSLIECDSSKTLIKYMWSTNYYYTILEDEVEMCLPIQRLMDFFTYKEYQIFKRKNKEIIVDKKQIHDDNERDYYFKFWILEPVAKLKPLDSFGDFALTSKHNITAEFHGTPKSKLMAINKEDYVIKIRSLLSSRAEEYCNILLNIPYFNSFSIHNIHYIATILKAKSYQRNQYVFREQEEAKFLYIVKSGEFQITKSVKVVKCSESDRFIILDQKNKFDEKVMHLINTKIDPSLVPENREKEKLPKRRKRITLKLLLKNDLFGQEDAMMKNWKRSYSVQCFSDFGELFYINKDMLEGLADKKETILTNNNIIRKGQENIQERIGNVVKCFPFEFPKLVDKTTAKYDENHIRQIKSSIKQLNDFSIINDIKKGSTFLPLQHRLNRVSSRMIKGQEEYKSIEESLENMNKLIESVNNPPVSFRVELSPSEENFNSNNVVLNQSDSSKKNDLKKFTFFQSPMVDSLLQKMRRSRSEIKGGKDKAFMTSIQVAAVENSNNKDSKIDEEIQKIKQFQRKSPKKASQEFTKATLLELSNEMSNQYKSIKEGVSNPPSNLQMKLILTKILESNKYIQNIVSKIKYEQHKNSNTLSRSLHNLFRKKKE